jgi:hypothetical protein
VPVSFITATAGRAKAGSEVIDNNTIARGLLESSSLLAEGRDPLRADHAEWTESDFEPRIVIAFPRTRWPLESQDRMVTFTGQTGPLMLRVSFPLRKMVYRGKLEL